MQLVHILGVQSFNRPHDSFFNLFKSILPSFVIRADGNMFLFVVVRKVEFG